MFYYQRETGETVEARGIQKTQNWFYKHLSRSLAISTDEQTFTANCSNTRVFQTNDPRSVKTF